jgi:ribosome maturation factor RimP
VEITLLNQENVITCYEMKMKKVTIDDINRALQKISNSVDRIDNYSRLQVNEVHSNQCIN